MMIMESLLPGNPEPGTREPVTLPRELFGALGWMYIPPRPHAPPRPVAPAPVLVPIKTVPVPTPAVRPLRDNFGRAVALPTGEPIYVPIKMVLPAPPVTVPPRPITSVPMLPPVIIVLQPARPAAPPTPVLVPITPKPPIQISRPSPVFTTQPGSTATATPVRLPIQIVRLPPAPVPVPIKRAPVVLEPIRLPPAPANLPQPGSSTTSTPPPAVVLDPSPPATADTNSQVVNTTETVEEPIVLPNPFFTQQPLAPTTSIWKNPYFWLAVGGGVVAVGTGVYLIRRRK